MMLDISCIIFACRTCHLECQRDQETTLSRPQWKKIHLHHVSSIKSTRWNGATFAVMINHVIPWKRVEEYLNIISKTKFIQRIKILWKKRIFCMWDTRWRSLRYCFSFAHVPDVHTDVILAGRRVECRHRLGQTSSCFKEMSPQIPPRRQFARQRENGHRQWSFYRSFSW